MSNKEEDFIPYYKIRYSRQSAWTLKQGAYLAAGFDPADDKFLISPLATNKVSKNYHWLLNKKNNSQLSVISNENDTEYHDPGALLRVFEDNNKSRDKVIRKLVDHMYSDNPDTSARFVTIITKAVYRHAGKIVFDLYPYARIKDVAFAIANLPDFYNSPDLGQINKCQASTIEPYLKGLSKLDQKPNNADIPKINISVNEIIELM